MKTKQIFKQLTLLFLSVILIVGCKETTDQSSVEPVSTTGKSKLSLEDSYGTKAGCVDCATESSISSRSLTNSNTARKLVQNGTTFLNTDYLSVGVGGLRNVRKGQIRVVGIFPLNTVTKAYLYWHGLSKSTNEVGKSITVNANTVTGTNIGISSANCWPYANGQAYRADVTDLVKSSPTRLFNISGFGEMNPNGASLVMFYSDADYTNNRDIYLFDGNDANTGWRGYPGNPNAPVDPYGWDVLLKGMKYTSGTVMMSLHVADGQGDWDEDLLINGKGTSEFGYDDIFNGGSVPGGGLYWDIIPKDVTYGLSPGADSIHLTSGVYDDCLSLVVAVFSLPTTIKVAFDFRPLRCPNTFPDANRGAEEAAILSSKLFDIRKIDLASIKLNGIPFKKSRVLDISAPYAGTVSGCSTCSTLPPDGRNDLSFLFDSMQLLKTMGTVKDKQCIKVTLTGKLLPQFGSVPIEGEDYILISKN